MHIVAGNDLREPPSLDVADLDKSSIEQKDVRGMEGNPLRSSCDSALITVANWNQK
jgi:hypothetical protein